MSTDTEAPHPMFAAIWAFWYAGVLYAHAYVSTYPVSALLWLLAFAWWETLALLVNWRWTLSWTVTWTVRRLSKHKRDFAGWNWLVDVAAFPIAFLVTRVCAELVGSWEGWALGAGLGVPLLALCHQHWLRPDIHA